MIARGIAIAVLLALAGCQTPAPAKPAKASPAEAQAYKQMLVDVAQQAADASNEGGFLGFGGVRVSDKEKAFIAEVKRAAGLA